MTVQPTPDLDEYIAALPVRPLSAPRADAPTRYQVSRWPLLKPYNGFCGIERRRGGQLAGWLLAAGCIAMPAACEICGSSGPLGLHGDNYYDVASDPALCRACHKAIHLRHWQWREWERIVDRAAATGREWFALLPRHHLDLAQHLRNRWGWHAADLESSPVRPLPDVIAVAMPGNMLVHPAL